MNETISINQIYRTIIAIVIIVFTIILNLTVAIITVSLWRIILWVGKRRNYNYTCGKLQVNLTFSSFVLQANWSYKLL